MNIAAHDRPWRPRAIRAVRPCRLHFKVVEALGAGGMGMVYRAEDVRLHRTVALEFMLPDYAADAEAAARFLREARSVAALDHPNICTVHEVGETEEGQLFLTMSYYAGETLKEA